MMFECHKNDVKNALNYLTNLTQITVTTTRFNSTYSGILDYYHDFRHKFLIARMNNNFF